MSDDCTWVKKDGRYQCMAKNCPHWRENGICELGKVTLTCDNNECKWNEHAGSGVYHCIAMEVHLDGDGKCLHIKEK